MFKISWKPSPNKFNGRSGHQPIAIVYHRMVGFLSGTDTHFANAATEVSAHFGIGYRTPGIVEISQYVDLSDGAWSNGNYDPSGGWTLVKKTSSGAIINPNYYTISIEHEDGGPDDGRVAEPVKVASEWLSSILLSGNVELIRHVGIRVRLDSTAPSLASIPLTTETLIDHNRIAGIKKPFCWRPYKLDTSGFPGWQPQLIQNLKGSKMAIQDTLDLLAQQVDALEDERDAAVLDANIAEAKLDVAKQSAGNIKIHTAAIDELVQNIENL